MKYGRAVQAPRRRPRRASDVRGKLSYNGAPPVTLPPWRPDAPARQPDVLLERLAASGLRGRGGGWFPAARKWRAVRVEGGEPVVVANGAEGEPGSFKDRYVMRRRPADVVAGLALAARAVGARARRSSS